MGQQRHGAWGIESSGGKISECRFRELVLPTEGSAVRKRLELILLVWPRFGFHKAALGPQGPVTRPPREAAFRHAFDFSSFQSFALGPIHLES